MSVEGTLYAILEWETVTKRTPEENSFSEEMPLIGHRSLRNSVHSIQAPSAPSLNGRTVIHHSVVTEELHRMSVDLGLCLCASSMPFAVEHRAMCKAHDPMREPFFSIALGICWLIHCFFLL